MTGYIYNLSNRRNTFLIVPNEGDFSAVPTDIAEQIDGVVFFKTINLDAPAPILGADSTELRTRIEQKGFDLVSITISFYESVWPSITS